MMAEESREPLSDAPLLKNIGKIMGAVIRDTADPDDRWRATREYHPHEEYAKAVLFSAAEIQTILTQLQQSTVFISNFRSTKKLKENGIGRFDHIVYHLEDFYIRVTGCLDRCIILVNVVLDLGNDPEDCSYRLIKKNKHVRSANVLGPLGEINGHVKPYRNQRNAVAHRERLSEPDLHMIEMFHVVKKSDPGIVPDHILKTATDQFVAKRKGAMRDTVEKLTASTERLFKSLKPEFDLNYERLRKSYQSASS